MSNREFGDQVRQLTAGLLRKELWVVHATTIGNPADLVPHLQEHLAYMLGLEEQGKVLAGGPFLHLDGSNSGNGMFILRAADETEARSLMAGDPLNRPGLRRYDLSRWQMNIGRLDISLMLSRQAMEMK
jgi:uncharacterized protein YciI